MAIKNPLCTNNWIKLYIDCLFVLYRPTHQQSKLKKYFYGSLFFGLNILLSYFISVFINTSIRFFLTWIPIEMRFIESPLKHLSREVRTKRFTSRNDWEFISILIFHSLNLIRMWIKPNLLLCFWLSSEEFYIFK